ncbi:FlgB family protein [Rhodovulum sp. DZ06]|uniref:FlgB family protein n=1 Tax=Rhodovulum sp. DZ06 TaxID=3425126 RepID=UPI003D343B52
MMQGIDILKLANGLAAHAGRRQSVISENVANADTPGYRARDLTPFEQTFAAQQARGESPGPSFVPRATRAGHFRPDAESVAGVSAETRHITAVGAASPNGNTVSLEDQIGRAAETKIQHDLALGVWRSAMNIMRASLGSGGSR